MKMRIAYFTDIHLGASGNGYHMQPYWIAGGTDLMTRFSQWVHDNAVELVICGGDLVEHPEESAVRDGVERLADLGKPVLIALGNHDLASPEAWNLWQRVVDGQDRVTLADDHLELDDSDLYLLNNHWDDGDGPGMYWDPAPPYRHQPCLADAQLDWLDKRFTRHHDRPAIVVVHSQLDPVPPNAPKLEDYIPPEYPTRLNAVLDKHPHCRLVLTGHCHVTTAAGHGQRVHLTTGALGEAPYEFRLLEVTERVIAVSTETLDVADRPAPAVDPERAWALGEPQDRQFLLPVCGAC